MNWGMKSYLRPITDDLYFIASRLKEIDPSYFVVYNLLRSRYEVHSKEQRGDTLCFVVPYKALDARTLEYAARTRNPFFGKRVAAAKERSWLKTLL